MTGQYTTRPQVVFKHSPGPWSVDDRGMIVDANGVSVAPLCGRADLDPARANGELIAQAPAMAAVLEALIDAADGPNGWDAGPKARLAATLDRARSVLAAANGAWEG